MSSTTSSDCDSCDCSQCNYSFENNLIDYGNLLWNSRHIPMYATMAHPLIYYAEIQPPVNRKRTCDQPKKDNPFKKAFKWYTQERTLWNKNDAASEISGFADWLDNKYFEYLRESGQQTKGPPTSHEFRTSRTITESCPPCPGNTKKFGRFKSPWRKRRRLGNDSGDVPEKCPDDSCEFLLKPKELTRAASDTCYHTPTSGGKSNSTVTSSNMPCNTKCSGRSQSLSDVGREKSVFKHGDTIPPAVQECPICACNQKQGRTKLQKSMCVCPQEQGSPKKQDATNQPRPLCKCLQEKVAEAVKVPSYEPNASNQPGPLCKCLQEKVAEVVKVPSNEPNASNQPGQLWKYVQKNLSEVMKGRSKEQDEKNQAGSCCKCPQEKVAEVVKVSTKEQDATNQPKPLQEEVPKVMKVLSKEQDPTNQLKPLQKEIIKVPSKVKDPTNQPKPLQEEVPKIMKVLSKEQDPTTQLKPFQKEIIKVPSKVQDPTNQPKPLQEEVPKVIKVLSKEQDPTTLLGRCCKCKLEKLPKVVQVPSQSRAVEESSQYPEQKIVPVDGQTQYEPTPEAPRSTQNLGPRCCKICNQPTPLPPQLLCIPVKVQSNKIANPEMCLTITPAQIDAPKKQKARRLSVSCQSGEGSESKVDSQSQHQPVPSACCKDTVSSQNNCHKVNQVFVPIPIRRQSYSTVILNEEKGEYSIVKEVSVVNKFTRSVTCASNDAAQTSDHSIRFEKDVCSCQYPLFFKIICADVSKNDE